MEEVKKLEYLSLVSKVCTELENHLALNDKDLAEFIIALADENPTFESFREALDKNGAEFTDSLTANLYRLIRHMRSTETKKSQPKNDFTATDVKKEALSEKFPFLAIPDKPEVQTMLVEEIQEKIKIEEEKKAKEQEEKAVVDNMMAALESFAPSKAQTNSKRSNRSRSRDRKRRSRSRSRSRDRRRRSGSRDRNRDRKRRHDDHHRSGRRSRSRSKSRRSRSPSFDRNRRGGGDRDRKKELTKLEKPYLSDKLPPAEPEVGKVRFFKKKPVN